MMILKFEKVAFYGDLRHRKLASLWYSPQRIDYG